MLICSVQSVAEEELVRLSLSLGLIKTSDRALKKILAVTEEGCHVVVVMDGAGWHTEEIAHDFKNVSVIKLSPDTPELNPIEQVWR